KGELHLGVFEGYEFCWARQKHPGLKPLAVAVNIHRYPVAVLVVKKTNRARDFAALAGQSLARPIGASPTLRLFVDRPSAGRGKTTQTFFSKVVPPPNVEDALDDVVDGVVQATVVERAALEAYQRRKPGRFDRLKAVARSQPFPPPVVAAYG